MIAKLSTALADNVTNIAYNILNKTMELLPTYSPQVSDDDTHGADDKGWSPMTGSLLGIVFFVSCVVLGAIIYGRHLYKKWYTNDPSQNYDSLVTFRNNNSSPNSFLPKVQNYDHSPALEKSPQKFTNNGPSSQLKDVNEIKQSYVNNGLVV